MSVDEHTIDLAGSPVFFRSTPAPSTPALFLHGVPTSSQDWVPFLERTGGIAPDLIGFGRSGKGGHLDYSIDGYSRFIEDLLEHLGINRVKLVAHDFGAAVGLVFAQRAPERIESIVVINGVPLTSGFEWHRLARTWRRPLVGELVMGATTKRLLARSMRAGGRWSDEQIAAVWEQFDQGTQRAILRLYRDASPDRLAAAGARLSQLNQPALVLWGADDPWLAPELGDAYARALSNATLERVPGAGHWPWLEAPELIDRVGAFLQ